MPFEVGFDRVFNFEVYFPHNNIISICKLEHHLERTVIFDYDDVTRRVVRKKPLYIKFIEKLKEKVNLKRKKKG